MRKTLLAASIAAALPFGTAHAVPITVTVANTQDQGGLSITPLWLAFTDGESFDAFDPGEAASPGVERIAEIGMADVAGEELLAAQATAVGGVIASPDGPPPVQPGETVSLTFDLDPEDNRFVQFLSMVLPTNDAFIGLDAAVALFGEDGAFLGPQTFDITAAIAFDAGTEANDPLDGGAFVAGVDATLGTQEGGVVTTGLTAAALGLLDGLEQADGSLLSLALVEAFFGGQASLGTVTFELTDAAPVPVPAAALLLGTALLGGGAVRVCKARNP